ncbi:GNAT family N-acetyltransferase [Catenovulum maritimum]|uniref:GNAT family N-acetyltransferase n=1 Tax=Catenovulum maritimum TaxID=1513271 RepID=UPI0006607E5C|nr:GNAT family N-acetyltransferase [Catenovulum maritimum]
MLKPKLSAYAVNLAQLAEPDIEQVRLWRNTDFVRKQMVNQDLISREQQQAWFYSLGQKQDQQHFMIDYKSQPIGVINIRALDTNSLLTAKQAEVGLYIGNDKYQNNFIAFAPSLVINDYAFTHLKIDRLASKVRKTNLAALKYNQQLGYLIGEDDNDEFNAIELTADNYNKATTQIKNWLSRG